MAKRGRPRTRGIFPTFRATFFSGRFRRKKRDGSSDQGRFAEYSPGNILRSPHRNPMEGRSPEKFGPQVPFAIISRNGAGRESSPPWLIAPRRSTTPGAESFGNGKASTGPLPRVRSEARPPDRIRRIGESSARSDPFSRTAGAYPSPSSRPERTPTISNYWNGPSEASGSIGPSPPTTLRKILASTKAATIGKAAGSRSKRGTSPVSGRGEARKDCHANYKARRWVAEIAHSRLKRFRKILACFEKKVETHLGLLHRPETGRDFLGRLLFLRALNSNDILIWF
jgi:hypothetical protein